MVRFLRRMAQTRLGRRGMSLVPYALHVVLEQLRPGVVLDVGPTPRQYGRERRSCGYRGRIASLEPLPGVHFVPAG